MLFRPSCRAQNVTVDSAHLARSMCFLDPGARFTRVLEQALDVVHLAKAYCEVDNALQRAVEHDAFIHFFFDYRFIDECQYITNCHSSTRKTITKIDRPLACLSVRISCSLCSDSSSPRRKSRCDAYLASPLTCSTHLFIKQYKHICHHKHSNLPTVDLFLLH